MKITGIEAIAATGRRTYVFVVVDTDEGITGVGECGLPDERAAMFGTVETVKELLVGQDPFRSAHLWQVLSRGLYFPARRELSAVISAVDMALWDIKGKALGVPVYELLGGRARDRVPCYVHVRGGTEDTARVVESAVAAVEAGWRHLRWGLPAQGEILQPRRAVRVAVEQFAALREAVGPDVEIALDVHTRLAPAEAVMLCRELEAMRPLFIEDPIRAENPRSMEMVRLRTTVPLAAGEQFGSKWEFRELVENEWIDYARIDLAIVGGFTEAMKVAGWCETHYIDVVPHNPYGPVANAAALHFSLACPNLLVLEQPVMPGSDLLDIVPGQPRWADGCLLPGDAPGLGITLDREAARRTAAADRLPQRFRRPDGSLTNW
ncbi:mandelate racemase/muconate lactonizing enzyme family protein [Nonomuraea sp. 10N515B]|uniref:mandelate racemase/muconate lactonizing enzyme family protein n=1 Tax=Nonomuraea sp. 10N515B TaxID=3457422 RepID=UPI003FCCC587